MTLPTDLHLPSVLGLTGRGSSGFCGRLVSDQVRCPEPCLALRKHLLSISGCDYNDVTAVGVPCVAEV